MPAQVILVEAQPARAADGVAETIRLAGGGALVPYAYGGQTDWRAGVVGLPTLIASLEYEGGEFPAGSVPAAAAIEWAPSNKALLSATAGYVWADAPITVRIGDEGAALPPIRISGKVLDAKASGGQLTIAMSDPATSLKKPLLTARFAGTGGLEGPVEWDGQIRRRVWGRVWNLSGDPIDPANNIYCFADPLRPLYAFDALRDKGAPAAALSVLGWQGSATATFAALQSASAPAGGGVVCPSIACVKWWTQPAGDLCADLRGEIGAGYVETTATIAQRLVEAIGGPAFAAGTVSAAAAARPAAVGWVAKDDATTVAAMLDELLGNSSLLWLLDDAGAITIRPWTWGAPVASAVSQDVSREQVLRPLATRKLGYKRNETPMQRGDLAAIVLSSEVTYLDGTLIETLKPAQGGATAGATSGVDLRNNAGTAILKDGDIITSDGTAAAIAGQGPGATATAGAVMNYAVQVGQNAIINSDFVRGLAGYSTGWTNIPNAQKVDGLNLPGWHGAINLAYTTLQGTPSAGVFDALRPYANTEGSFLGSLNRYTMPVVDGDRVFASALVAIHRNSAPADVKVIWFDGSGNYLTESTVGSGGTDQGGANGNPTTLERVGGFANAPANARWASIIIRAFVDGTKTDPYLFYGQMMLSKVPAGQTAWPPYMPGPADRRADTTFENTAAAIAGQGYFATQNYADWGSRITGAGKPQDNATFGARVGVNLRNSADTAYLGDVDVLTAAGTAAAIAGQGYFATQNYADWSSRITGAGKPQDNATVGARVGVNLRNNADTAWLGESDVVTAAGTAAAISGQSAWATYGDLNPSNVAGQVQNIQTDGYIQSDYIYKPGVAFLKDVWPAELGANVTEIRTAAAISGQGYFATQNYADWGSRITGAGKPQDNATVGARVGVNLRNNADTAWLGESDVVTSFGTAAGFSGQSAWATYNGLNPSNVAGQVQHLESNGYLQALRVYKPGVAYLHDVWPAENGANVTEGRTAAAIAGQGPWATSSLAIARLTKIKPNLFPYPFGVDDGRSAAQIGWSNTDSSGVGFGFMSMGRASWTDGGYYGFNRSSGAATTIYPYYDMTWNAGSGIIVSAGMNGYAGGGTFSPYIEFINAAKNSILGSAGMSYNSQSDRWEANGATVPSGTAFIRVVPSGVFGASSGAYQDLIFWGVKVEVGPNATPCLETPDQRVTGNQVEWATGAKLNALRPAEANANITENRTAAAISGQSAWATYSNYSPASVIQPGANLIYDAGLALQGQNWALNGWNWSWGADIGYYVSAPANANMLIGGRIPIYGSAAYTFSIYCGGAGYSGTPNLQLNFYDSSDTIITQGVATGAPQNTGYGRYHVTHTAPANAAYARCYINSPVSISSYFLAFQPKLEMGSSPTIWTDDATYGARYQSGGTIDALKPAELGANITENRAAAAIAGQGYFATQNYAGVSRLLLAGYDNIIPDADYRDPVWWGFSSLPNVSFITGDSYWEQERLLRFVCDRDFDFYSTMFAVEPNSTYRVRARIWNNGGSWSGAFWPLIHMPNVAWWSLKHGTGVDDNVANAANAIVANGDTGYQDLYFRVSANSMRKIQFRFKSTARGSDVLVQVAISKVPQLGKDLIKSGTATKYLVAEIETGQGIAAAIAGQGAGATANNLAQLDPTAAGQLTTAYNGGVQSAAYGETIKRKIGSGGTLALSAIVNCAAGGVSGSITCVIQSRPYGGSWSNVASGSGSSTGPSEPGGDDASGTFTNSTGIEQVFEFRVVESRTPSGAGGSILASQSYVTG